MYLGVILIWISQMTNVVKHLFMCLLAIHISFVKYQFKSFAHFLELFVFLIIVL